MLTYYAKTKDYSSIKIREIDSRKEYTCKNCN